ncbi:MAG TPA: enoyl-CoA hydratase-related protein [Acidimicrobiales bacterium]|jgi:enoyl-CoA hydratase|nr:enoyl-CoA hydratase-related protein [Acidimicrobiales bacterium]
MSTGSLVACSVENGVGSVRLSDPAHRNALSAELSDALALAVASVLSRDAGAIVLTADPPVFCAGGSLDGLLARDVPLADTYRGFEALAGAPVPTIAAVGSPAIGAGVNLPLACDIIVVSQGARFDPRFLDVGIHPGGGHLWRLQRRIGSQGAAALVLCGDVLDGRDAVTAGLAWRCVEEADLEATAHTWARRAARRSRALVARTKATLRASESMLDVNEATALELEAQRWSMEQPGFDEGIRAIQESLRDRPKTDQSDG